MKKYHKIQSVYKRDPATKHKTFLEGEFSLPEFEYLKDCAWYIEEKVDGTNIRVNWDGESTVTIGGRTADAQIPTFLMNKLWEMFHKTQRYHDLELPPFTLYGEGYGAKIQKGGGDYIHDGCGFILFDVMVNNIWLDRDNVWDFAQKLGIKHTPIYKIGTLLDAIQMCKDGFDSMLRKSAPEGVVCRPVYELRRRNSERIITKVKLKDFVGP
jgi:ATP-dependent RNA circularization protein (DNA/RNA ligase family)